MEAATDVQFDFEGSLILARRLWALADHIEAMMTDRRELATRALTSWLGPSGTDFGLRLDTEVTDITSIATDLRSTAVAWAACWQAATEEQDRIAYTRALERIERERTVVEHGWGAVFGHLPPPPAPVPVPSAPHFLATAEPRRY